MNMASAGALLGSIIENAKNKPSYLEIFANWNKVVGEYIASISHPYKVANHGKNKILFIKSIKGRSIELQHESLTILNIVNAFLRENIFSQIKVVQMDTDIIEF